MKAKKFICFYEMHTDGEGYIASKVVSGYDFFSVTKDFNLWCADKGFTPVSVINADYRKEVSYCLDF